MVDQNTPNSNDVKVSLKGLGKANGLWLLGIVLAGILFWILAFTGVSGRVSSVIVFIFIIAYTLIIVTPAYKKIFKK